MIECDEHKLGTFGSGYSDVMMIKARAVDIQYQVIETSLCTVRKASLKKHSSFHHFASQTNA